MDAILATIAKGGQAIVHIDREANRNKLITHLIYNLIQNPWKATSLTPFVWVFQGCGMFVHQNHAAGVEIGSSWWGCLWAVCFASKKPSKRNFLFLPKQA